MKKLAMILAFLIFLIPFASMSQNEENEPFPVVKWSSKSNNDTVTIDNGAGIPLLILITVDGGSDNASGVNVSNCGTTKHIDAGSSTICSTNDPANPVSFSTDNANVTATGTYQVRPQ